MFHTLDFVMPSHLERRYGTQRSHFITCSCYRRAPLLSHDRIKQTFLTVLEETRQKYQFCVYGYVIMPEHFHLLIGEPETGNPGTVMQVLKQRVSHQGLKLLHPTKPKFWETRFYDFNVWSHAKKIGKLRYMHRNPVKRGLVARPEDWPWSSFRHYAMGEIGPVEIESEWTALRRERDVHVLQLP